MSKHTPAPWMVDETKALGAYGVWQDVRGRDDDPPMRQVCSVIRQDGNDLPREERDANARLIASAPDLLAACKACLPYMRYSAENMSRDNGASQACDLLEDAIAKAEGNA